MWLPSGVTVRTLAAPAAPGSAESLQIASPKMGLPPKNATEACGLNIRPWERNVTFLPQAQGDNQKPADPGVKCFLLFSRSRWGAVTRGRTRPWAFLAGLPKTNFCPAVVSETTTLFPLFETA